MIKSGRAAATAEHPSQAHQSRSARSRRVGQRVAEATRGLGCTGEGGGSVVLTCDGELRGSAVRDKARYLTRCAEELLSIDPSVTFYEMGV